MPCLNKRETLPLALDQLLSGEDLGDALVVAANGGSSDGKREWLLERTARDPRLRLRDNPERIKAAGVNGAVKAFGAGCR